MREIRHVALFVPTSVVVSHWQWLVRLGNFRAIFCMRMATCCGKGLATGQQRCQTASQCVQSSEPACCL